MGRFLKLHRNKNYVWPDSAVPPVPSGRVRVIDAANAHDVEAVRSAQLTITFQRFLAEGRFGVFAMSDGTAVGHAWVTAPAKHHEVVNKYARLEPGECLIHYCYVDPAQRGQGIYSEMLHSVTLWALEAGAKSVRVDTSIDNGASQRGIIRAGFEETESTTSFLLGRWLFWTERSRAV